MQLARTVFVRASVMRRGHSWSTFGFVSVVVYGSMYAFFTLKWPFQHRHARCALVFSTHVWSAIKQFQEATATPYTP